MSRASLLILATSYLLVVGGSLVRGLDDDDVSIWTRLVSVSDEQHVNAIEEVLSALRALNEFTVSTSQLQQKRTWSKPIRFPPPSRCRASDSRCQYERSKNALPSISSKLLAIKHAADWNGLGRKRGIYTTDEQN